MNDKQFEQYKDTVHSMLKLQSQTLLVQAGIDSNNDTDWHSRSAEHLKTLSKHQDHILALATLNDGCLVSASKDRTVKIWSDDCLFVKDTLQLYKKDLHALAVLHQTGELAIAVDNIIKIYEPKSQAFLKAMTGHTKTIYALQAMENGFLVSAGQDQVIKLWDTSTATLVRSFYGI